MLGILTPLWSAFIQLQHYAHLLEPWLHIAFSAEMCTRDTKYKHQLWTGRLYRRGLLWLGRAYVYVQKGGKATWMARAIRPSWPNELVLRDASYFLWKVSTQIEQLQLPSGAS